MRTLFWLLKCLNNRGEIVQGAGIRGVWGLKLPVGP
jgi:hypothetical protein